MTALYTLLPPRLCARNARPRVLLAAGLLLVFPLATGCKQICSDDGFAWQQDPSCVAALTATTTTGTATDTDATATATMTDPTDSGGDGVKWCTDGDGDGFGDPTSCTQVPPGQAPPDGSVDNDGDCDDADGNTFPGAAPNDDAEACMKDADGDDWGDSVPPGGGGEGGPVAGSDCDDSSSDTFPGAAPNDDAEACMKDEDGDDWGDSMPPGGGGGGNGIVPGTDCDDANNQVWDSCVVCDDVDGDGWLEVCDSYPPDKPGPDCDDNDPNTFPGAAPNDDPNACMTDADGDDWGDDMPGNPRVTPGTDCDDASASTYPGAAAEDPNACMKDEDGDGHGDASPGPGVTPGSDCFDANPNLNPANNILITAPISTGEVSEVDLETGALNPYAMVDVGGFDPWLPVSLAVHPTDSSIYAALVFQDALATMNYCGGGTPTMLQPHNKTLCGIGFDRDGVLYGIDGVVDQLVVFNPDGSVASTFPLTYEGQTLNVAECGMAYDCHQRRLLVSDSGTDGIYAVNTADGTTTRIADLSGQTNIGRGLEYDPTTKGAISCDQTSLVTVALDGSNNFSQLSDLAAPVDDLVFGPMCN